MKNFDIRKYAIFTIVCFLSFFGYRVYADAAEAKIVTPNKPTVLVAAQEYENAICSVGNKTITSTSDYNDGKYHIYYGKEDYNRMDIIIESTEAGVGSAISVSCVYDNRFKVSQNEGRVWLGGKGGLTVNTSAFSLDGASRITLDMDEQFNSEYTITSWIGNIGIMDSVSINDPRINTSACLAGTDTCKITLNSPVTSSGQVIGEIKYHDKDTGGQNTLTVVINIKDTWFLKADGGNYAKTCSFSPSIWEKRDGDSNVWYSKQGVDVAFNNVQFPSCEVDTDYNPLIEFKGWVYQKREADLNDSNAGLVNGNFQTIDYCTTVASQYPTLFGFVSAGQSADPRDIHYGYIFACYASRGVALDMNGGTASLDGNIWKFYTSKNGLYSGKHGYNGLYTYTNGGNVVLPISVEPPAIYANTAEFKGWKNKKTGELVAGGTTVNGNDGTIYTAVYEQKGTSGNGSSGEVEIGGYEIKTVFVGEVSEIILQNGYTCNTYSDANFSITDGGSVAGESRCKITGLASTNGQFVNVPFVNTNGATFTYKIMVSTRDGLGGPLVTGNPTINIQINTSALVDRYNNGNGGFLGSEGSGCQHFKVSSINDKWSQTPLTYTEGANKYQLDVRIYGLTCMSEGYTGVQYDSLCLDPGRSAPPDLNYEYIYERTISPDWSNNNPEKQFDNAVSYIIFKTMNVSKDSEYREALVAANVAVRIVEFVYGQANGYNDRGTLPFHYRAYKYIADNKNLQDRINAGNVTKDDLIRAVGSVSDSCDSDKDCYKESIISKIVELLNFREGGKTIVPEMSHPTNEVHIDSVDISGYKVNFSGKIILPKASTVITQVQLINKASSLNPAVIKSQQCGEVNGHTECIYSGYVDTAATKGAISGGTNIAVKIVYKSNYSLDNAVLLRNIKQVDVLQRFIAFNKGNLEALFYLNLSGDNNNNCNALIAAAGESEESAQIAVNAGCCTVEIQRTNPIFYNKYCRKNCTYDTTYNLVDGSNDFICTDQDQDVNSIKEATTNLNQENYACIVDVSPKINSNANLYQQALTATENMTDFRGNILSVSDYNSQNGVAETGNPYCRVTCKEDWTFKTPGFSNFTGENAVKAGSYFTINQNMSISSTKTCVTTYIDIEGYQSKIDSLSRIILNNTNSYLARASAMSNRHVRYEPEEQTYYETYERGKATKKTSDCTEDTLDKEGCSVTGSYINPITSKSTTCTSETVNQVGCSVEGTYESGGWDVEYTATAKTCKRRILFVPSTDYIHYYENGTSRPLSINGTNQVLSPYAEGTKTKTVTCDNEDCGKTVDGVYIKDYGIESAGGYCNTYSTDEQAINALTGGLVYKGDTDSIENVMKKLSDEINRDKYSVTIESTNFGKCQNFYIDNDRGGVSSKSSVYSTSGVYGTDWNFSNSDSKLSNGGSSVKISDKFDPLIKYKYDEETYMSYIGDNNKYILDEFKNKEASTSYYNSLTDAQTYTGVGASGEVQAYQRVLCTVPAGQAGGYNSENMYCKLVNFYYYNAHYIKTSLSHEGTFKNNVTWFIRQYGGIIYPGTGNNKEERLKNAKKNSGNENDTMGWSRLGENDVFPVQLNTRRNVYQYVFTFENIGTYMEKDKADKLGRIMGSENSVAIYNFNTCFYEVYEGMCLCCGRTMSSTARVEDETDVVTSKYFPNYKKSKDNAVNASGTLGFYTNSVSLSDLTGASNGFASSSNWGDKSEYFYNGEIHYTDKGSSLAAAIQNKGETIYGETPEYSYTLNPSALSAIRNMEHSKNYAVQTGDLTTMGSYKMHEGTASNDGASYVLLTHFKSNFLDKIKTYETAEYKGLLFTDKQMADNCYVTNAADVGNSKYKDCRWIDYMDNDGYRLVFK